ncbi:hypothetical protein KKG05_10330 [bacterium]|nr:hypothetical protein [bacterium]
MSSLFSAENRVKVALFFLAIFLWLFVISNREYDADFVIPIELSSLQPGYLFAEDPPKSVRVSCSGRGRDLLFWRYFHGARLKLDISGYSAPRDVPLLSSMITVPAGFPIRDLQIASPETLHLDIDRVAVKRVPVRVDCEIIPASGFMRVGDFICEPDSVFIRGPRSLIEQVDELTTRSRRIGGARDFIEVQLTLQSTFSPKILLETRHILVKAVIEAVEQVNFDSVFVEIRNLPQDKQAVLSPEYVSVIIEGPQSSLAALDTLPPHLVLDYEKDWNEDSTDYEPTLDDSTHLKIVSMAPPKVIWTIE